MSLVAPFHHVLPVHEELFSGGLYVTHAGWERVLAGEPYPKQAEHPKFYWHFWDEGRVLPEFCLALVLAGGGESETRRWHKILKPGDTFLVGPGEWHRHRPLPGVGWDLLWIHFNGGLPCQWLERGYFGANHPYPELVDPALFRREFERLVLDAHAQPLRNSVSLSWQAIGLLSHFRQEPPPQTVPRPTTGDAEVDRAVDHIWNYSHGILDVPVVVAASGLGRRSLERRFREAMGHGLLDEIQNCRFTRAAWLLVETDLPVKTVVGRAGFSSHEQMRLVFHKKTGRSPEAYREAAKSP